MPEFAIPFQPYTQVYSLPVLLISNYWNKLPVSVFAAPSVKIFKERLKQVGSAQDCDGAKLMKAEANNVMVDFSSSRTLRSLAQVSLYVCSLKQGRGA